MADAEAVKSSVRLSDVVERYGVTLKPAVRGGKSGVCPLHRDTAPSFMVYDDGHYYCYGCQAGGDVISFIQAVENTDFKGAVDILVRDFGADNTSGEEYRQIRAKQKLVYEWYAKQLGAVEELAMGYSILCRKLEQESREDAWFDAEVERQQVEALAEAVEDLGTQGDVLVALYDNYGPKSTLPPIKDAAGTLEYSRLASLALQEEAKSFLEWRKQECILFLADYRSDDCIPPGEGPKAISKVIADTSKALKVIDGIRSNSKRSRSEVRDPGYYPSRGGGRGRDYQKPAA